MSATPETEQRDGGNRRRWLIVAVAVIVILAVVLGVIAVWLFFFGSEAPPAPTLNDALQVLATPAPAE